MAQLFSDDPEVSTISVDRAAERGADRHHAVAARMLGKEMSPFVVRPGRTFTTHPHPTHLGQEFIFVHSGRVELSHDGRIIALEAGDCAYFDASAPHKLRQIGEDAAEVVVVAGNAPRPGAPRRRG